MIGGVGQRMISGVARKTAGGVLRRGRPRPDRRSSPRRAGQPRAGVGRAGRLCSVWRNTPSSRLPAARRRRGPAPAPPVDLARLRVRDLMIGAAFGAVIALLGVLLGAIVAGW